MAPVAGAEAAPGSARDDNERVTSSTDRASDIEAQVAPDFHSEGGSDAKGQLEEACAMPRECRICLGSDDAADLAAPCGCSGSCRYAHMRCLLAWCQERRKVCCELCGQPYREPYLSKLKAAVQAAAAADALPGVEQGGAGAGGMRAPGRSSALEGQGLDGLIDIQYFASQQELQAHVRGQWRQFGCQATLLIALLLGMLYVALFVDIKGVSSVWPVFIWRTLMVGIPLYLVGRMMYLVHGRSRMEVEPSRGGGGMAAATAALAATLSTVSRPLSMPSRQAGRW